VLMGEPAKEAHSRRYYLFLELEAHRRSDE